MIFLALWMAAQTPAPTTTTTTTTTAHTKVLVLELTGEGVSPTTLRLLSDAIASELARQPDLQVLSSEDVKRALDVEAERQLLSCNASSCMAEIASAMGASTTVYGSAGKVGSHTVVTLNAFDAQKGQSVGKELVDVADEGELLTAVKGAALRVMGRTPPSTPTPAPKETSPLLLAGGAAAGGGVVVGVVGAVVYGVAGSNVAGERGFEGKTTQKTLSDIGGLVAIGGGVVALAGGVIAVVGLVGE